MRSQSDCCRRSGDRAPYRNRDSGITFLSPLYHPVLELQYDGEMRNRDLFRIVALSHCHLVMGRWARKDPRV